MDLQVRCPSCKILLKVPANLAGKKIRCTKCEQVVAVPASGTSKSDPAKTGVTTRPAAPKPRPPSDVDDDDDRDERDARRPDRSKPGRGKRRKAESGKSNTGVWVGISLGVLGMVAVLIGLIYAMTSSDGPQQAANNPNPPNMAIPPQPMFIPQMKGGVPQGQAPDQAPVPLGNAPDQQVIVNVPQQPGGALEQGPLGAVPNQMASTDLQRVKQATVLLRVTMANGQMGEGSGFFALEKGLIMTNAHVVGMMQIHSPKPRSVQVVLHSGEPNEKTLTGTVLGCDGSIDLAVVKVADAGALPTPLRFDSAARLTELQDVYIFGFPLGSQLGKNITVSKSSISSLRKDPRGAITQVQVNGGMHPGNSGGPVVDARGIVVGIAVAGIMGTQINFAVPADFVQSLIGGRIRDTEVGAAFRAGDTVKLPVKVYCTDPMQRIRAVNLDVWTAPPGPPRLATNVQPAPQPGDANKQTIALTYKDGIAQADIDIPATPPGEALWLQAIASADAGAKVWAATTTYRPDDELPLERVAAKFQLSNTREPERTVHITGTRNIKIFKDKEETVFGDKMAITALEHVQTEPRGISVSLHPSEIKQSREMSGKDLPFATTGPQIVQRLVFTFLMSPEGGLKERGNPGQLQTLQAPVKTEAESLFNNLANCYEATALLIPLRQMEPGEMWVATAPLLLNVGGQNDVADMQFSCTYEGRRTSEGKDLGYIRIVGDLRGRTPKLNAGGRITGHVLFDLVHGFIAKTVLVVDSDVGAGAVLARSTYEIQLNREAGNPKKIAKLDSRAALTNVPGAAPAAEVKKGKSLLNISAQITLADPVDKQKTSIDILKPPGGRFKEHKIMLKAGVTYVIEMTSPDPKAFDPYLRLQDDAGKVLSYDDDSGGNMSARIIFTPTKAGQYRIIASPFLPDQLGSYTLTVSELAK